MNSILVIGYGDLVSRILPLVLTVRSISHVTVLSRSPIDPTVIRQWQMTDKILSNVNFDATDEVSVADLIRRVQPSLIVQGASLVSPWTIAHGVATGSIPRVFRWFGAQLPFQAVIPNVLRNAMIRAHIDSFVVNLSYPDAVNALIFSGSRIAGAGNIGIVEMFLRRRLGLGARDTLRLVAHHAHTVGVVTNSAGMWDSISRPQGWTDAGEIDEHQFLHGHSIKWSKETNTAAAIHAYQVIKAVLDNEACEMNIPGPNGLVGGYPCKVGQILTISNLSDSHREEAIARNLAAARLDGLIHDLDRNQVSYVPELAEQLENLSEGLSLPLAASTIDTRSRALSSVVFGERWPVTQG